MVRRYDTSRPVPPEIVDRIVRNALRAFGGVLGRVRVPVYRHSLTQDPQSQPAAALRMSRREMLGERQVAAPLMAQRAAHRAL